MFQMLDIFQMLDMLNIYNVFNSFYLKDEEATQAVLNTKASFSIQHYITIYEHIMP